MPLSDKDEVKGLAERKEKRHFWEVDELILPKIGDFKFAYTTDNQSSPISAQKRTYLLHTVFQLASTFFSSRVIDSSTTANALISSMVIKIKI